MARDVWAATSGAIPTRNETGGIWQQIVTDTPAIGVTGEFNLWATLGERPSGMWGDLEKETLLLHDRTGKDIWDELNDETLIIRPKLDLWREIQSAAISEPTDTGIWAKVGDETLVLTQPQTSLWNAIAQAGDYTQHKPTRRLGWALKKLETVGGEQYYILKNLRLGTYLRLNEEQVFLWNLMDGQHTLRDMAVAYFVKYKSLTIQGLVELLSQLQVKGLLVEERVDLFAHTAQALGQGRIKQMRRWLVRAITQITFSIRGIDNLVTKLLDFG